jgi:hypothetical protein
MRRALGLQYASPRSKGGGNLLTVAPQPSTRSTLARPIPGLLAISECQPRIGDLPVRQCRSGESGGQAPCAWLPRSDGEAGALECGS